MSKSEKKRGEKSDSPMKKVIIGIIITVVAGGTPWWWNAIFPQPALRITSPECSPEARRNQLFQAGSQKPAIIKSIATTMESMFDRREFECVSNLATVLLDQDPDNGHGLYFEGETWRAKAGDSTQSSYAREKMQEYFLKYIANERDLDSSERNGNRKACYEREKGYCAERTAWINHLMAIDYYYSAEASKDKKMKKTLLERATKYLEIDLGFNGGFDQIVPSQVLKDKINDELRPLDASPKDL